MNEAIEHVCLDCSLKAFWKKGAIPSCPHFQPEWWQARGYKRNWGDAAVMLPEFEILRGEGIDGYTVTFVILAPILRRPLIINTSDANAWGSY